MKHLMKFMAGVTLLLLLSGCMDTATRLWNGGPYISEKKREAYHKCYAEVRAQDPVMAKMIKLKLNCLNFHAE